MALGGIGQPAGDHASEAATNSLRPPTNSMTLVRLQDALEISLQDVMAVTHGFDIQAWQCVFDGASLENVVRFARGVLDAAGSLPEQFVAEDGHGAAGTDHAASAACEVFKAICTTHAVCASLAVGSFLTSRQAVTKLNRRAHHTVLLLFRTWYNAGAHQATMAALVDGRGAQADVLHLCARWLCSFVDLAAPFGFQAGDVEHVPEAQFYDQLVTELLEAWFAQANRGHEDGLAPDMFAQLALRGQAERLATQLAVRYVRSDGLEQEASFVKGVLKRIAQDSPGAATSVVGFLLIAFGALMVCDGSRLLTSSRCALYVFGTFFGGCMADGGVVQHFLAERVWQLRAGVRMSPPVLFRLVDFLVEQSSWPSIRQGWLQRWSEAAASRSADLEREQALALRVARAIARRGCLHDGVFDSTCMQLLLQGVHARLSARIPECKWYGMAVAEVMARHWPHTGGEAKGASLRFEGFDLGERGLAMFHAIDADYDVDSSLSIAQEDLCSSAAALNRLIRCAGDDDAPVQTDCMATAAGSTRAVEKRLGGKGEVGGPLPNGNDASCSPPASDTDSDDEDADNPLRSFAPLPRLQQPPDPCNDLRLAAAPRFLRAAFEMLHEPNSAGVCPGDENPENSSSADAGQRGAPGGELPARARARMMAALAALPDLVAADPPDLPQLVGSLIARLLRVRDLVSDDGASSTLRQATLSSLLVADGSRRRAAELLVIEVGCEDITLATRLLILDAFADAAKRLSNRAVSESTADVAFGGLPAYTAALAVGAGGEPPTARAASKDSCALAKTSKKTRRFASATQVVPSKPNRFASELRHFVLPLVTRWQKPDPGSAAWAAGDALLIGSILRCIGTLIECAGPASPDRDAVAAPSLDLVDKFGAHKEPFVRRCGLFLLSRLLLVGVAELVVERRRILERLERCPFDEGDEVCRKMANGIAAWLQL